MTDVERIAAEVAARYGVAVHADAVQIVPRGVSALGAGVPSWSEQVDAWYRNDDRGRRLKSAEGGEAENCIAPAPEVVAVGERLPAVKAKRVRKAAPKRPPVPRLRHPDLVARDAILRELVGQGLPLVRIAERFGVSAEVLSQDCKRLGIKVVRPVPANKGQDCRAPGRARRLAREAAREALLARMRDLAASGLSMPQVAREMQLSYDTARKICDRAGIKTAPAVRQGSTKRPLDPAAVLALWAQGLSMTSIAARQGWCVDRVRRALDEAGVARDGRRRRATGEVQARLEAVAAASVLGLSAAEIADRLGLDRHACLRARKALGLVRRRAQRGEVAA